MMFEQRGGATLLITSVLLIAALLVTLGSTRTVFFQIKRAQNELESRKQHWVAEGGLECVYTKAKNSNSVPTSITECKDALSLSELTITTGAPNVIHSKKGNLLLNKAFNSPTISSTGAIRSASDLVINGSYTSSPDPGKNLGSHEWQCTSVRYLDLFYATSYNTYHPWQVASVPLMRVFRVVYLIHKFVTPAITLTVSLTWKILQMTISKIRQWKSFLMYLIIHVMTGFWLCQIELSLVMSPFHSIQILGRV